MTPEDNNRQPHVTNQQIMHWYQQINSRFFLIGGMLRRQGAQGLARAALQGNTRAVSMLAGAVITLRGDPAQEIAADALMRVSSQNAIDAIWRVWQASRNPLLGSILAGHNRPATSPFALKVLSALKLKQPELLTKSDSTLVEPLFSACTDTDPEIVSAARAALLDLENPSAIDAICKLWAGNRNPLLEEAILQSGYMARKPSPVRVLCALKLDRPSIAQETDADGAQAMVGYCQDPDNTIATRARNSLAALAKQEARDAVCRVFNETLNEQAREAALAGGYLPGDVTQRAIFFFLTGQWERYAAVDFDQRLMRAYYEGASAPIRQNIARTLQSSGRADLLTIIAGADLHSRTVDLTHDETAILVEMLANGGNWPRLWQLALDLPLHWSQKILHILVEHGWQPKPPAECALFQSLALIAAANVWDGLSPAYSIPPAVQRARVRATSRINDVAFSPTGQVIAIGTGNGRVALWDFHKGEMQRVLKGFNHSITRLAYDPSGILACGERTNGSAKTPASVFIWDGSRLVNTGNHREGVTVIEPVGDFRFLTGGRDLTIALVDGSTGKRTGTAISPLGTWPRHARLCPNGIEVLLHYDNFHALNTRTMSLSLVPTYGEKEAKGGKTNRGVTTEMLFLPDGSLLAGKWNGLVARYQMNDHTLEVNQVPFTDHAGKITGIELAQYPSVVVTASADGDIQFNLWETQAPAGRIHAPGERLTSMRLSPDGDFLATGDSNASLTLWDLRSLALAKALKQPMLEASPRVLPAVNILLENQQCNQPVSSALSYFKQVVEYRLRFDIDVADAMAIQAGEFDIIVE